MEKMSEVLLGLPLREPEPAVLRDGTQVIIRRIRTEDAPRLQSLFGRLSRESIYYRCLEFRKELTAEQARRLAALDYDEQMALVAACEQDCGETIIGVARYAVVPGSEPREAEAAVVVEDRYQGLGLGSLLLERLTAYAVAHGIRAFMATVRQDNGRVMHLVRRSGLPTEINLEAGTLTLWVGLQPEVRGDAAGPGQETGQERQGG